ERERRLILSVSSEARAEEPQRLDGSLADPPLLPSLRRRAEHRPQNPGARPRVLTNHRVLQDRHVRKQVERLEGPRDAEPGDLVRRPTQVALPAEGDVAGVGSIQTGDQVADRAL